MAGTDNRIYYMDAARALMLLLGIPFHVSEVYRVSGDFLVSSPDTSYIASFISASVHVFRMPGFFLMSGFFAALILARRKAQVWLKDRAVRLGVPLIAATLLLGPNEFAIRVMINYAAQNVTYWQAIQAIPTVPILQLVSHRWFLIVLLMFCVTVLVIRKPMLAFVSRFRDSAGDSVKIGALAIVLLLMPFATIFAGKVAGEWFVQSADLKFIAQQYTENLFFFLLGFVAYSLDKSLDRFLRWGVLDLLGALAAITYIVTYFAFYRPGQCIISCEQAGLVTLVRISVEALAAFFTVKLFYLFMRATVNSESKVVRYFVDASFCIYIVHAIFYTTLAGVFLQVRWPPIIEMAIISAGTVLGAVIVFEIMRRSTLLSYILNGGPVKRPAPTFTAPPTKLGASA
jgi:glucan biosynthesis protein C